MPDELTGAETTYWIVILVLGFVVILAVVALLSLLVKLVMSIDAGVGQVRDTLGSVTQNTANTTLIGQTADSVDRVLAEGLAHHLFLGRVLTGTTDGKEQA